MRPDHPLDALGEAELVRLARIADRLAWCRVPLEPGGRSNRHRPGRALEFLDYRGYVPGDDPRRIDWRASARRQLPLIRRNQSEASASWCLCLDRSASMGLDPEKWGLAIQLAAAFIFLLLHRDFRVGLLLFSGALDGGLPPGRGRGQFRHCLSLLDATRPVGAGGGSSPSACLAQLPRQTSVILVSDLLVAGAMHEDLARLQALGGELHALQVLADDECPLPPSGAPLYDIESGATLLPAQAAPARAAAIDAAAREQAALARFCTRRGIVHSCCQPRLGWGGAVTRHLGGLGHAHA